jgi:hypothetical protein
VAGEVVLKPRSRAAAGLVLAALFVGGRASADNVDDDDLIPPQRLTVGVTDDLLGQLGPCPMCRRPDLVTLVSHGAGGKKVDGYRCEACGHKWAA